MSISDVEQESNEYKRFAIVLVLLRVRLDFVHWRRMDFLTVSRSIERAGRDPVAGKRAADTHGVASNFARQCIVGLRLEADDSRSLANRVIYGWLQRDSIR